MAQLKTGSAVTVMPDDDEKRAAGQLIDSSYKLTHTEGFDAWLRNRKGSSQVLTGDDLVKKGSIEATGSVDTVLPPMSCDAVVHAAWGVPARVLHVRTELPLSDRCAHGEVLVRVLAAAVGAEDFARGE